MLVVFWTLYPQPPQLSLIQLGPESLFQSRIKDVDNHIPGRSGGGSRSGGTVTCGRQGSPEASARALGLLRQRAPRPSEPRAAEPERCRLTKRRTVRRRRQERRSEARASPATAPQELPRLRRGDPGQPPRYVPAKPRAPTWRSWDCPRPPRAGRVGGLGCLRAPLLPKRQGGQGESLPAAGTPPPPMLPEPGCCSEPG